MPKNDFVWLVLASIAPSVVVKVRPKKCCVVSMQYDNSLDSCEVLWAESPLGHCKNFLGAVIMASSAHQPGGKVLESGVAENNIAFEVVSSRRTDRGECSPMP